jgi:DNA topoisomerase-1
MDLEKAVALLSQPKKGRGKASAVKEFGQHPNHDVSVSLFNGPYGPYLKAGKANIGLPEGTTVEQLTPELAFTIVNDKLGTGSTGKTKTKGRINPKASAAKKAEALGVKKVVVKKSKK